MAQGGIWELLAVTRKVVPNYHCGGGHKLIAVIEGPTATLSLGIATMLGPYQHPQLSYGLLNPALRSKVLFPALYGMVPHESFLLSGIARLIQHFNWRWVGLMASEDDRGERAVETLAREIGNGGGCIAFTWMFKQSINYDELSFQKGRELQGIFQKPSANVTVLYGTPHHMMIYLILSTSYSIWMRGQVWILTTLSEVKTSDYMIFHGSLLLVRHKQEIPGFQDFLQRIKPRHYPADPQRKRSCTTKWTCFYVVKSCPGPGVGAHRRPSFPFLGVGLPVLIPGVLGAATTNTDVNTYPQLLAFVHAVEEINRSPHLLPNISLGFHIYDSVFSDETALGGIWGLLSGTRKVVPNYHCGEGNKLIAVIEGPTASFSLGVATVLGHYRYPQLSYGLLDPARRSKVLFPALYGMVPSESSLLSGVARLIRHFDWRWVGLITSDDDRGERAVETLAREIAKGGGCLAFTWMFKNSDNRRHLLVSFQKSSANVTVLHGTTGLITDFRKLLFWSRIKLKGQVWILTAQEEFPAQAKYSSLHIFHGSLLLVGHKREIPGFQDFLQRIKPWHYPGDRNIKEFWRRAHDCSWLDASWLPQCTGEENLTNSIFPKHTLLSPTWGYSLYNAVYTVAHALHAAVSRQPLANVRGSQSWQLLHFLTNMNFTNPAGEDLFFDGNGDLAAGYDVLNLISSPKKILSRVPVGSFHPQATLGHELIINKSAIQWASGFKQLPYSVCSKKCLPGYRKKIRNGEPACCFDCVPCTAGEVSNQSGMESCCQCMEDQYANEHRNQCLPKVITFLAFDDSLGLTLSTLAISFSLLTACVLVTFVQYRDSPIVKANNLHLSYILLISLLICFLSSLMFIGCPTKGTCLLQQTIFAVAFAVTISSVLAKTITVVLAFKGPEMGHRLRTFLRNGMSNSVVLLGALVQVLLCSVWLGTSPPFPQNNTQTEVRQIVVQCNEGSIGIFFGTLGYLGILAAISFTVAFLARKLPDSFNEAKHISFSMVVFCCVWISFIPAYLSSQGKTAVAIELFSILASSAGILACIFTPKVFIILVRPDRNSKKFLRRK
ncbi:vomeronasal type-2 receptor 26-like [Sphaerodactylus townsendi]|uniref:vomeronasal type-2 receptor 26-like n=1 Tax=Sphaerodactylus townsendi TaxID=933632 RepID=UPI00202613A3|nr:vomeronasal type-2 receptor 26-like [Sphaerodactylus townsendi]